MSIEALWTINFEVPNLLKRSGGGVIVLESGRMFGGDSSFYYVGDYCVNRKQMSCTVQVKRHNDYLESIIPGLENWTCCLNGELESDSSIILRGIPANLVGSLIEEVSEITVKGRKICNLP